MIKSYLKTTFALSLALALGGFATAYGQYEVTGTTAGGGNVVTGMGNLPPLATDDGSDILTAGGSDHLTLIIGSFASTDFFNSDYSSTITFGTPNDVFINKGTIEGATDEEESPTFGAGVDFLSNDLLHDGTLGSESISNITFVNNGNIFGANDFDDNEVVGSAVNFLATDSINGVSFTNTGLIEGASIDVFDSGFAGSAVNFITESGSISNIGFTNSGNLFGGSENDSATFMGNAVVIAGENGVYNVTINNQQNGNIVGGNENFNFDDPFVLGSGNGLIIVDFNDFGGLGGAINNVSVNNAGDILGGNDNEAGDFEEENDFASAVSNGVVIVGLGPVNNVTINNTSTGLIQGGNESDFGGFIGNGAVIASINDFDEIDNNGNVLSNVNVMNAGRILGGNNNDGDEGEGDFQGMEVGNGLVILGGTSVTNVNFVNVQGGSILGGNNNLGNDESVGSGIDITTWFGGVISNVSITNSGKIQGGSGNNDSFFVGMGIGIDGEFTNNITITNNIGGFIAGGDGNFGDSFDTGAGIAISAENLNGLNISNWGLIRGGNDISEVESNSDGGDGIDIFASNITNSTITNHFTGVIEGGLGGGDGIFISASIDPANLVINNFGHIFGGNGDAVSGNTDGGWGIEYEGSEDAAENIHINNFGWIQGGNSGGELAEGGIGVAIDGNNTRLDNWGVISGGTGSPVGAAFATPALPPPDIEHGDSILVSGSGNVINLNGHSWVIGKITVEGPTNSNTVNLNFTGLTPLQIANLNSQLSSQGVGSGSDTSVTFTVRGVTYDIDPAVIHFNMSSYQLQGVTPNQSAIGAALDSAQTNPNPGTPLAFLFNAIDQAPNQARAIEELSPQPYQIYGDIALANANFTTLEIDQRLYNLRDGSEGVDTAGLNGGETSGLTSMLTNGLSKNDDKGKGVITPMTEENRWGFFAAGNGIFSSVDAHGGDLQDANFTSSGILLGLDGKIHEHWIVGTFFNYEHTWADLDSQGSSADINSYSGGIYAGYHNGGYYGNGLFSYTRNDYSSQRNIRIAGFPGFNESAGGSTSGNQFEGDLDGGYDFNLTDRVSVGPIAGLQYVHLDVDGFSESGAPGAGLAVGSQSLDSLRSRLVFHANYHMKVNQRMSFAADLHAQWQHEFLDDSRGISAAFEGDGLAPFAVQTTSPERDAALLGLGANLTVRDRYTFFLDYDVQAGQQDYLEQSVKGGFKYSW